MDFAKLLVTVRELRTGPAGAVLALSGQALARASVCLGRATSEQSNKAPEPTPTAVTFRADARPAPAAGVAHL